MARKIERNVRVRGRNKKGNGGKEEELTGRGRERRLTEVK